MTAGEGASARAVAMGVPAVQVDGNDVEAVHTTAGRLVAELRGGAGPCLLHARTYRIKGHVSVDPAAYRDPAELAAARETDPIARACARYLALGGAAQQLERLERAARAEVARALEQAEAAPWPDPQTAFTDVQSTGAGRWY